MKLPVYVISLQRNEERREQISQCLHNISVDFCFFDAIDAKDIKNKDLISRVRQSGGDGHIMTDGEIACTLSHQLIYNDIVSKGHEWALILEDDVIVDMRTKELLEALSSEEHSRLDDEILYLLGGQKGLHEYPVLSVSLFNFVQIGNIKLRRVTYNQHKIRRACCYLVSHNMCKNFIELTSKYGYYRADSWNMMKKNGLIKDFYLSEIISHPVVNITNSNLELERVATTGCKMPRTSTGMLLKKSRSWLRCMFFSLYR